MERPASKPAPALGTARPATRVLVAMALLVPFLALLLLGSSALRSRIGAALPGVPSLAPHESRAVEDRAAEVRGRIVDADGNPVEGASVRLVSPRPPYGLLREVRSDAEGRFAFGQVGPDAVRVVADRDPGGVVSSADLRVVDGRSVEVVLVLAAGGTVSGVVVDPEDHGVAGAALSVEGAPWIARSATSDASGAFRIAAVPDEATALVAVARGYRRARVALARRDEPGEVVVRVRLTAAPSLEGDVVDADGKAVRARVVACEGQASEARVTSAEDGTFELPAFALGCAVVAVHDELGRSEAVVAAEGERLELRLKAGGSIDGVVVDEGGRAVSPFTVGIESLSGGRLPRRPSGGPRHFDDPGGAFQWDKLGPGTYVLSVTAPGKPPTRSDPVEVVGGSATKVQVVLRDGGSVTGHVYDEAHVPIGGADLRFDAVSSLVESASNTKTDDGGGYRLDAAPSGPFTLRVQKDGFRVRMVSGLRVDAHGTLTEDVTLTAMDGGAGTELGGIGAGLTQTADGIALGSVFPGDPADRSGLRAGDRILRIDGDEADRMSLADALQRLRGEPGTTVTVSVARAPGETVDVQITRATIVH